MIPLWLNYLLTALASVVMAAVCAWIVRRCWLDSKDDFRMAARELRDAVERRVRKKKRAD